MKKSEREFITVMDLGSDSIRSLCAQMSHEGKIEKVWFVRYNSLGCVDRGWLTDLPESGNRIRESLMHLSNAVGITDLGSIYVCLGGQNTHVKNVFYDKNLINKRPIGIDLIEEVVEECKIEVEKRNEDIGVVEIVPFGIEIDGIHYDIPLPTSIRGKVIRLEGYLFYTKKENIQLYKDIFNKTTISVAHFFYRPHVLLSLYAQIEGEVILQDGCAIIDLGAQTTSLIVYKGNNYFTSLVIPKGGKNLTSAISHLGISFSNAEKIKCKYGYASPNFVRTNSKMTIQHLNKEKENLTIDQQELSTVIATQLEEVLSPLISVLNRYKNDIQTVYITGGGSMLRGINKYIQKLTPVKVIYGAHNSVLGDNVDLDFSQPTYASLIGLLYVARSYQKNHKKKPKTWFGKTKDTIIDIFTNEQ